MTAAQKRIAEQAERADKLREKWKDAESRRRKAEADLEWLEAMPVDDEPDDDSGPTLFDGVES